MNSLFSNLKRLAIKVLAPFKLVLKIIYFFPKIVNFKSEFARLIDSNEHAKALMKDWGPNVILETTSKIFAVTMKVRDSKIAEISFGSHESEHDIIIRARLTSLISIATGKSDPATCIQEGKMEVIASDIDQLKLDAFTFVFSE